MGGICDVALKLRWGLGCPDELMRFGAEIYTFLFADDCCWGTVNM